MDSYPNKKISVVIPCYGSQNSIEKVVGGIKDGFTAHHHPNYEIILISDDSPDDVYTVIKRLAEEDRRISGARLSKNFGQHAALMLGYRKSSGDIVVSMDDDGETPASGIFSLVSGIDDTTDVVYASYQNAPHGFSRSIGTKLNRMMARSLANLPKNIKPASFFAMKRSVANEIIKYKRPRPYILGLVLNATHRLKNVPVNRCPRLHGKSGYSIKELMRLWLDGFFMLSSRPFRTASIFGILLALAGLAGLVFFIANTLRSPEMSLGCVITLSAFFIIGGILTSVLGVLARRYSQSAHAPQYIIREETPKAE